jgi:hypothetical protein
MVSKVTAPPSVVEVRESPPVHIQVPQQTVVVDMPPAAQPTAPQFAMAPQAPQFAMAPQAPQFAMAPQAPQFGTSTSVQNVPVGRSRIGFVLDTIRIPLPFFRPIAVPTQQEVTYTVHQPIAPQFVQQSVATQVVQPMAVQPVYQQPMAVQPVYQQPVAAQPVYQQPMAVQPVYQQPVAAQPVYQQQPQYVQVTPQAPVSPQAMQPVTPQTKDEYCRQLDAMKAAIDAARAAAGCAK